jgi:hypothetical protein
MDEIIEILLEAREELKRLEHIIYVSLKYTRTVDVIINALNRLVGIYDLLVEALLEKAKGEGLIDSLAKSPALRAKRLGEMYEEDIFLNKHLRFYSFLKTILNMEYKKFREYRRHVALVVNINNCTAEANIDNLINCERFVHNFYNYAREKIDPQPKEEE